MRYRSLLVSVFLGYASAVEADVKMEYVQQGSARSESGNVFYFAGERMRMELAGNEGQYLLFDAKSQSVTMVQPRAKRYTVIDANTMAAMTARLTQARQQVQSMLAQLTPQQREQAEKELAAGMSLSAGMEGGPGYQRTGKHEKVAGYACEIVTYSIGDASGELCVATEKELGLSGNDAAVMEQFTKFSEKLGGQLSHLGIRATLSYGEIGGVPIRGQFDGEQVQELKRISHGSLAPELFAVPRDYQRSALALGP